MDPNLTLIETADRLLGDLLDELCLVGGCVAGLLVQTPGASPIRVTEDVDLVLETTTLATYDAFALRLRQAGFSPGVREGDPICRLRHPELAIDLMPLDESILGFSNRWYRSALEQPAVTTLSSGRRLRHLDAPHFVASKLEAFRSRGAGDFLTSSDLEDVAVVWDGRPELESELHKAPKALQAFVREGLSDCLANRHFSEAVPGYFSEELDSGARGARLIQRWQGFRTS